MIARDDGGAVALRSRINWPGIFAGVLAGVITYVALLVLGLAVGLVSASGGGLDLGGLAIGGLIYLVIVTAASAYLAGLTTARAAAFLTPAQGRFNGLLTGILMLALSTWAVSSLLGGALNTASNVAGSVLSAGAQAAGAAANNPGISDPVGAVVNGLDRNQLVDIISQATPELSQQQVGAAADVVGGIITNARNNIANTVGKGNVANLGGVVSKQLDNIGQALQGPQFVSRLQRQGLSQAQAQQVATTIQQRYSETRTQVQQTVDSVTKAAARAASTAAWVWLLTAGLVLGLSTFGGGRGGEVEPAKVVRSDDSNKPAGTR